MEKWKTLSSEYIFRRPWLTARRDVVELPNGQIHDEYYVLDYPTWVNTIAITEEGLYVMVRQYRHAYGDILTELCAGCADPGEDPMTAAQRELEEETGYTGGRWSLQCVISPNAAANSNLDYCYLAEGVRLTSTQHLDRTEDIEVVLLTRDELFDMLRADQIKQAMMAAPLWRHFCLSV